MSLISTLERKKLKGSGAFSWLAQQLSRQGGWDIVRKECSWLGSLQQAAVWEMRQQE